MTLVQCERTFRQGQISVSNLFHHNTHKNPNIGGEHQKTVNDMT